jgi:hypothetical protein
VNYNFDDKSDYIHELIQLLNNGFHVIVYSDLLYWSKMLGLSQQFHIGHSAPLLSYNNKNSTFQIFDIDKNLNYKVYTVKAEQIKEALTNTENYLKSTQEDKYPSILPKQELKQYDYSTIIPKMNANPFSMPIHQVISNAKRLVRELTSFKYVKYNFETMSSIIKANASLGTLCCTNYTNIQKGNQLLFNQLHHNKFIDYPKLQILTDLSNTLFHKTKIILGDLIKGDLTKNWSNIKVPLDAWSELYEIELTMWGEFLKDYN